MMTNGARCVIGSWQIIPSVVGAESQQQSSTTSCESAMAAATMQAI